jgi:purine-binding chemotaxis protein CheW
MSRIESDYLLVRAGGRRVGLALTSVVEVLEPGAVHSVPSLEPAVRGVTTVRGRILPVVDLAALLRGEPCAIRPAGTAVVVEVEGRRVCLEVDEAEEVLHGGALPVPSGTTLPWSAGVARHPEGLIPLLDLTALGARMTEAASA